MDIKTSVKMCELVWRKLQWVEGFKFQPINLRGLRCLTTSSPMNDCATDCSSWEVKHSHGTIHALQQSRLRLYSKYTIPFILIYMWVDISKSYLVYLIASTIDLFQKDACIFWAASTTWSSSQDCYYTTATAASLPCLVDKAMLLVLCWLTCSDDACFHQKSRPTETSVQRD